MLLNNCRDAAFFSIIFNKNSNSMVIDVCRYEALDTSVDTYN
jgi:hypothetical protein